MVISLIRKFGTLRTLVLTALSIFVVAMPKDALAQISFQPLPPENPPVSYDVDLPGVGEAHCTVGQNYFSCDVEGRVAVGIPIINFELPVRVGGSVTCDARGGRTLVLGAQLAPECFGNQGCPIADGLKLQCSSAGVGKPVTCTIFAHDHRGWREIGKVVYKPGTVVHVILDCHDRIVEIIGDTWHDIHANTSVILDGSSLPGSSNGPLDPVTPVLSIPIERLLPWGR
jgi:hypothetical protein